MRILTRYIVRESLSNFAVCLVAFTGLLFVGQLLKFTHLIINKGVEVSQIAMIFVAVIPTFLEVALPMSVLLGIMLAFGRLSGDSEIIVIRASGISLSQLIVPVLRFGLAVTVFSLVISLYLRPWGYRTLAQTLFEVARTKTTAGLSDGVFNSLGNLTLYSEKIGHRTGELSRVLVDDRRNGDNRQIITAKSGLIASDAENRTISIHLMDGTIHQQAPHSKYNLTRFNTNSIVLSPDEIYDPTALRGSKRGREMGHSELSSVLQCYRTALDADTESTALSIDCRPGGADGPPLLRSEAEEQLYRLEVERVRRFSMPFAAVLLALVAMPLGIQPPRAQRAWGASLSVTIGLAVFVVYYGLMSLGMALSENGTWNPVFALWLPNLVTAALAVYVMRQMGSERWQSLGDALERALNSLRALREARRQ